MFIQPWDAGLEEAEWQTWIAEGHDFGQLSVNGLPGHPPTIPSWWRSGEPPCCNTVPAPTIFPRTPVKALRLHARRFPDLRRSGNVHVSGCDHGVPAAQRRA
jgi:hypothetical protein